MRWLVVGLDAGAVTYHALQTSRTHQAPGTRSVLSSGWQPVVLLPLLVVCLLATALAGLAIGWFPVWFQLFGDRADGGDYQVAAGAYAISALVLVLGVPAARAVRAPRWVSVAAAAGTAGHLVLALVAASHAATADRRGAGLNGWQDGAAAVLACPWTWPVLLLGLVGALRASRVSA